MSMYKTLLRSKMNRSSFKKITALGNDKVMDFLSYPLGEYTMNNIKFVEGVKEEPRIYSINYFMRNHEGVFKG